MKEPSFFPNLEHLWSLQGLKKQNCNKTNNGLERYIFKGKQFLLSFTKVFELENRNQVSKLEEIRARRIKKKKRGGGR